MSLFQRELDQRLADRPTVLKGLEFPQGFVTCFDKRLAVMLGNDFRVFFYGPLVVIAGHYDHTDLVHLCEHLSRVSDVAAKSLQPFVCHNL
jgi:hypothetical protein